MKFLGAYFSVQFRGLQCSFHLRILQYLLCGPQGRPRRTVFFSGMVNLVAGYIVLLERGEQFRRMGHGAEEDVRSDREILAVNEADSALANYFLNLRQMF